MMTNAERPSVVLFAYSEVGRACLDELIERQANLVALFTHPDGRDENIWFRSCADRARERGVPVFTSSRIGPDEATALERLAPDLILSAYYRALIPEKLLATAPLGAYNMHGALLPRYRGRAPLNWAVVNGETETGVTLHLMTDRPDAGPIVDQQAFPIDPMDTGLDVFMAAARTARVVLGRSLAALEAGKAMMTVQDENKATTFGRRRPADGELDWRKPASQLFDLIRSVTHPFPGAFTALNGRKIFVWWALPVPGTGEPGQVVSVDPTRVATGDGLLELRRTAWADGPETDGALEELTQGVRLDARKD